jgi:hypothetical protein
MIWLSALLRPTWVAQSRYIYRKFILLSNKILSFTFICVLIVFGALCVRERNLSYKEDIWDFEKVGWDTKEVPETAPCVRRLCGGLLMAILSHPCKCNYYECLGCECVPERNKLAEMLSYCTATITIHYTALHLTYSLPVKSVILSPPGESFSPVFHLKLLRVLLAPSVCISSLHLHSVYLIRIIKWHLNRGFKDKIN